jgi:hypothetical protein
MDIPKMGLSANFSKSVQLLDGNRRFVSREQSAKLGEDVRAHYVLPGRACPPSKFSLMIVWKV